MTALLQQAFAEAGKLTAQEQDEFAQFLLAEMTAERRWDEQFARSQDVLERLAAEALAEHEAGLTEPLTPGAA
jgi:hypothetical protein